jgi:hypothetical protein
MQYFLYFTNLDFIFHVATAACPFFHQYSWVMQQGSHDSGLKCGMLFLEGLDFFPLNS